MAFGSEAFLQIARQNSAGTATTVITSFHNVPFVSENLVVTIPRLISDTIRAHYEEGPSVQGIVSAAGDVVIRPAPVQMGLFCYAITGAASSTQINSSYQHVFVPAQTRFGADMAITPFTIQKYTGTGATHQFTDSILNRFALEIRAAQYLRLTAGWMTRIHSLMTTPAAPSFPGGVEYTWNQTSVSLGGAGLVNWEDLTITVDNALEMVPTLDGTVSNRRLLRRGFRTIRVTATADLPDLVEFNNFRANSVQPLVITVQGLSIGSGNVETLKIDIPSFFYEAYPIAVSGPSRITVGLTGIGQYNAGSATAIMFTVQNTQAGY